MSAILIQSRRGVVAGLASLFAAPAIVSAASLMPVKAVDPVFMVTGIGINFLTIEEITREAVALFQNTNFFLQNIDQQYDESFGVDGAKVGTTLRIMRPLDYMVSDGPRVEIQDVAMMPSLFTRYAPSVPDLPAPLAIAAGVAAVACANPELSRRGSRARRRETGNHMET